jgi:hypothetical protein
VLPDEDPDEPDPLLDELGEPDELEPLADPDEPELSLLPELLDPATAGAWATVPAALATPEPAVEVW